MCVKQQSHLIYKYYWFVVSVAVKEQKVASLIKMANYISSAKQLFGCVNILQNVSKFEQMNEAANWREFVLKIHVVQGRVDNISNQGCCLLHLF